ncbi:MAG TPA: hypothetical protein VFQ53_24470 [Kofleriaceae bacterium]|nr:hypothetical protein [Kofleriaceae bacterium]
MSEGSVAGEACPKCGAPRTAATACPKCGLATERMDAFAQERDASIPDVLTAAWERAVEQWDDASRHDEVMRLVAQHDAYAWAAARYRTRAGDPIGDRQLERVRKAAEVTLFATASQRREPTGQKPYRALTTVMVLLVVAAIGGLLYATVVRDRSSTPPGATPAEPVKPLTPGAAHLRSEGVK